MNQIVKYGNVYMVRFRGTGHQICGWHPGVVVSNDIGNKYNSYYQVIPISSAHKGKNLPTHVFLDAHGTGLKKDSWAQCEGMTTVNDVDIKLRITQLSSVYMQKIAIAVSKSVPILHALSMSDVKTLKADITSSFLIQEDRDVESA